MEICQEWDKMTSENIREYYGEIVRKAFIIRMPELLQRRKRKLLKMSRRLKFLKFDNYCDH